MPGRGLAVVVGFGSDLSEQKIDLGLDLSSKDDACLPKLVLRGTYASFFWAET